MVVGATFSVSESMGGSGPLGLPDIDSIHGAGICVMQCICFISIGQNYLCVTGVFAVCALTQAL